MRKMISWRGLAAAAAVAALVSPSVAVAAKAKPKAKAPGAVTVTNARAVDLTSLAIQTAEDNPRVVGTLPKGLAAGKSAKLTLKKPKGCTYNIFAQFADQSESEAEGVDLCKDAKVRLTE